MWTKPGVCDGSLSSSFRRLAGAWSLLPVLLAGCATTVSGDVPGGHDSGVEPPGPDGASPDAGDLPDADKPDGQELTTPDAAVAHAALVGLAPSPILVAHGGTQSVTITINQPARASGEVVSLTATSGTAATFPGSATIPAGMTSATFEINGVSTGGPFELTATLGNAHVVAPLRVVPALTSIAPGANDVTVGETAHYTVALEAATPVALEIALTSAAPGVVSVPASIVIPAGQASAGFDVTGVSLGGPIEVHAGMGGVGATTKARALGVYLSEVLYDVNSTDNNLEWVELYNAAPVPVDISGLLLQSAGGGAGVAYSTSLVLAGTLAPGQCAVVGGPSNLGVTFFQAADFNPDLGNASNSKADGIRLATGAGGIVDAVIYGGANTDAIQDQDGVASAPDVGLALANQTMERTAPGLSGPWQVQATPSPGDCTPIAP